jgi:hypothetical protein
MKLHYFFQSLKGEDDVLAEIFAGNLHVEYIGKCRVADRFKKKTVTETGICIAL